MSDTNGRFGWYELMTTDVDAASAFYAKVVGWTPTDSGMPGPTRYMILNVGAAGVGGVFTPEGGCPDGARPGWIGYIFVDDVDAYVGKVVEAGGSVFMPADDIPGVGRFSVVADPYGAVFTLFKPFPQDEIPPQPADGAPGTFGWRELMAGDLEGAFSFYSKLFGWVKTQAIDMGPMGTYQLFAYEAGGPDIGGMMTRLPDMPVSFWNYYAQVDSASAARDRAVAAGATTMMDVHQVPGGSWIYMATDPQGAGFAVVSQQQ